MIRKTLILVFLVLAALATQPLGAHHVRPHERSSTEPPWEQTGPNWVLISALLSALVGGGLAYFSSSLTTTRLLNHERKRAEDAEKAEKHKVANALMNEMFHTLKFLAAGHKELTRISKKSGSVSVTEISQTYPSSRAIYVSLGLNVGALSEKAAEAAVNFDLYIQALERDFDFLVGGISPLSNIDPEIALKLAKKVFTAIEYTTKFVECMADEVGGAQAEATKKKISGLKKLIGNSVNH